MSKVIEFVKKYWRWLLTGLAVLAGFWLGLELRKKPVVVIPGPSDKQKDTEKKTAEEEKKLDDQAKKETEQVIEVHDATIDNLTDDQRKKYEEIKDNPQAVNDLLSDVGKQMRGG
jgi:hypothetical protein